MTSLDENQITKRFLATSIAEKMFLAATILLIVLSSVYLISKSLALNFDQYQQYRSAIFELQELDSTFNQEILKSRYELFSDYDPLVRSLEQQKNIANKLQNIPDLGIADERQNIEPILGEIDNLLNNRESFSERFKSRNALLKNSLRYLPLLTSQLEAKFDAQEQANILTSEQISALRSTLNGLIRNLLLYNVAVDENLTLEITALTQQLDQLDLEYELTEEQFPTELVKSHANIILTLKPQIEQLTSQLLQPLDQYTRRLELNIDNSYKQAVQQVNLYRLFTCIWFLMLLIFVNYFFLKKLHQINPSLSRYKKQIGKLTKLLTEIHHPQHAELATANLSALTPAHIPSDSDTSLATITEQPAIKSGSELVALADRSDELGQLARRVQAIAADKVAKEQITAEEKANSSLTARLTLVTQNRQRMISPTTVESLKNILENMLAKSDCQLIELQGSLEQIQILFSYSPQVQLLELIAQLKAVSSSYLEQNLGDLIEELNGEGQIWSNSYSLQSCEVVNMIEERN
ncbi:MAG: DAHL domain-containing protein [Cyanobacteria bacterium P01_F01_bin.143]